MSKYNKNNILAIPELKPYRHYETSGNFEKEITEEEIIKEDRLESLVEKLEHVIHMTKYVPDDIKNIILKPLMTSMKN